MTVNDTPTVSALLATNNRPDMVRGALQSILDQTFTDFEVIVVDDGQEVSAEEAVRSFDDSRIRYIKHDTQRGCAGSRITGINASSGRYIAYLDDDDRWMPEKLSTQVARMEAAPADVGFSFTAVKQVFDTHTQVTTVPDGVADYFDQALAVWSGFLSVTLLFKREVFETIGVPDPSYPSHTDIEFILRVSKKYRGVGINEPLTFVNSKTDHSHMGIDFTNRIRGCEMLLARHEDDLALRPHVHARHLAKLAWYYRSNKEYERARQKYAQSIMLDVSFRRVVHYLSLVGNGAGYRMFRTIKALLGRT